MQFPISEADLLLKMRGEDSFTQFKSEIKNAEGLAEEMVAFANGDGGYILVGVAEDKQGEGKAVGVENIKNLNNHISNASSENCVPAIFPKTQSIVIEDKYIVVIYIEEGNQKPYRTKTGKYLMRAGADKRMVSQEELARMLQGSGFFHVEELEVRGANIETELDRFLFALYFQKIRNESLDAFMQRENQGLETVLNNLSLANGAQLNMMGLLLFAKNPQQFRTLFMCQAAKFQGKDVAGNVFDSKKDIQGNLERQYQGCMAFFNSNLNSKQVGDNFNETGKLEISEKALQEAIINALVHRDYGLNGTIRLFIFDDRVEIISPGALPNHLTIQKIMAGSQSVPRNPILTTHSKEILPFSRMGSGIRRIFEEHPKTDLINDKDGQQFKVIFWR